MQAMRGKAKKCGLAVLVLINAQSIISINQLHNVLRFTLL